MGHHVCEIGFMWDWKCVRLEECEIGKVRLKKWGFNSVRLEDVGLEECKIKRVWDWKSVRSEVCEFEFLMNPLSLK